MSEWLTSTLLAASERVDYGFTASSTNEPIGPRFLRITDIDGSHVDWASVPFCIANATEESKYALANHDIVVARTGASTGRSQWIKLTEPSLFASYLVRFRIRPEFDSRFVSYVLQTRDWHDHVDSVAFGKSAQPNMSAGAMSEFRFKHPRHAEQQAIAEVLGALDDKIAANTTLVSRSAALAATEFAASIRAGSSAVTISDATTFVARGITPNYSESTDSTMLVLNQKCVRDRRVSLTQARRTLLTRTRPEKTLQTGDILVNSTGQGTLGRVARWTVSETATVDSHITIVRADPALHDVTVFGQGLLAMESQIEALAEGSTGQTELSRVELGRLEIRLPSQDQQSRLGPQLRSLIEVESAFETENRILAEARDALLPQLMSGKLRVRDAEQLASEAGA